MNCVQVLFLIFVCVKCTELKTLETTSVRSTNQLVEGENVTSVEESALKSVIPGARQFAADLYSSYSEADYAGNVILSPLSLQLVLALVLAGAKGDTYDDLAGILSLEDNHINTTMVGQKGLIKAVQNKVLNLANRMFVEKSLPIKEDFQKIATEYFFSSAESLDFRNKPDESRQHINSWVERHTNDKIRDILGNGSISAATRLVLVNAIHFKANWKTRFSESDTKEQQFFLSSSENVSIPMMNMKSAVEFLYDVDLRAKFLRLDYEGDKFEMIVILPDDLDGLPDLEIQLSAIDIFDRLQDFVLANVNVSLPKFKMESTLNLKPALISMGAPSVFSETPDLGGITDGPVSISSIVQKAFIEVSENGTEAAAATAAVIVPRRLSATPKEITFIADHPFGFIISLKQQRIPIFYGRYFGPNK